MRYVGTLAALLLLASAVTVQADQAAFSPRAVFYAGGGLAAPMAPTEFKDGWKLGWGLGGGVGYLISPMAEIRAFLGYNSFGLDVPDGATGVEGGDFSTLEVMAEGKLYPAGVAGESPAAFYIVGGFGIARAKATELTTSTDTVPEASETKLAFDIGVGIDIAASEKAAVFVEVKYVGVTTEGDMTAYAPVRAGIRF